MGECLSTCMCVRETHWSQSSAAPCVFSSPSRVLGRKAAPAAPPQPPAQGGLGGQDTCLVNLNKFINWPLWFSITWFLRFFSLLEVLWPFHKSMCREQMQHSNKKFKSAVYRGDLPPHYSRCCSQFLYKTGLNMTVSFTFLQPKSSLTDSWITCHLQFPFQEHHI